jgi:hypothetical protein
VARSQICVPLLVPTTSALPFWLNDTEVTWLPSPAWNVWMRVRVATFHSWAVPVSSVAAASVVPSGLNATE